MRYRALSFQTPGSSMRRLILIAAIAGLVACKPTPPASSGADHAPGTTEIEVSELSAGVARKRLDAGELTSHALTQAYLTRINQLDRAGPRLNSVIELN